MIQAWKAELDAIVGARHGGAAEAVLARLKALDSRHPNVPEIALQVAWTEEMTGRQSEAAASYEKAAALGLQPEEHAGALMGLAGCLCRLSQWERAASVLDAARLQFPEHREFEVLQAIQLHLSGNPEQGFRLLMDTLAETSEDNGIRAHQRSLRSLLKR